MSDQSSGIKLNTTSIVGSILVAVIMLFITTTRDDMKETSDDLKTIEIEQARTNETLKIMSEVLQELKANTVKRYTSDDAKTDFDRMSDRITVITSSTNLKIAQNKETIVQLKKAVEKLIKEIDDFHKYDDLPFDKK